LAGPLHRRPQTRTGLLRAVPAVADGHPQGQLIAPLAARTAALVARAAEVEAANAELSTRLELGGVASSRSPAYQP
jgi:hypothetical protein